jgi:hypothetical protein
VLEVGAYQRSGYGSGKGGSAVIYKEGKFQPAPGQ